ncbi:polysaccharide pyruvyl transferase family protein [Frigidibacter oleivorans]|uniref:polysaccharide pyruvyl transferase family protein n=1 Tax=Frigidibacter oleivorans TaxID=2487129 RepID=UPI000F8C87D9|nr:polysaccharide pyruvyl transferase family protein [Frigidibacter oleivorans]
MLKGLRRRGLSVRDARSQQVLRDAGIEVPVVPDLAFLQPFQSTTSEGTGQPLALISFRDQRSSLYPEALPTTKLLAELSRSRGLRPVITWQVGHDADFSRKLAADAGVDLVELGLTQSRLGPAQALYDNAHVIFSNRLHSLLIAGARGALPVPVLDARETKVRSVFEEAGLGATVCAFGPDIAERAGALLDERASHMNAVETAFHSNATRLQQFFDQHLGPAR